MPSIYHQWHTNSTTIRAKSLSRRLAAIYYRAGMNNRGQRTYMCCDTIAVQNDSVVSMWRCMDRLCPLCCIVASRRIAHNAQMVLTRALMDDPRRRVCMLTLTQLNCDASQLSGRITDMISAWRAIIHGLRGMRTYIAGYARTIEITIGRDGRYHPHVHAIIIFAPDAPRSMFHASMWAELWRSYMGTDVYQSVRPVCDIRPIRPNRRRCTSTTAAAAAEVAKYTAKSSSILQRSDAFERIITIDAAIRGRKLRTYGGIWRSLRAELRLSDTEPLEEPTRLLCVAPVEVWQWSGASYVRTR